MLAFFSPPAILSVVAVCQLVLHAKNMTCNCTLSHYNKYNIVVKENLENFRPTFFQPLRHIPLEEQPPQFPQLHPPFPPLLSFIFFHTIPATAPAITVTIMKSTIFPLPIFIKKLKYPLLIILITIYNVNILRMIFIFCSL